MKQTQIEWREIELRQICKVAGGFAFKSSEFVEEGIPIVRISNFDNDNVNLSEAVYYPNSSDKKYKEFLLKDGDILIAMSGATTGKIGTITKKNLPALLNQRVGRFIIKDKNEVLRNYLLLFVKSKYFQEKVLSSAGGCAQPNISSKNIESISISLPYSNDKPDLKEQERIVKILEKADKQKEKSRKAEDLLDEYLKSRFNEMFGNPVTNSKKWEVKKLEEISIKILNGTTPKGGNQVYVKKGIYFFRSQNVWKNRLILEDIAYIDNETHAKLIKSSLNHKDILMTKTGRINTENSSLGRAAMFLGEDNSANINGHVYLIRLQKRVIHEFVLFILTTKEYREYIRSVCVGGIDKRQINKEHLINFPIIFPPIELQQKFTKILEQVGKMKENVKKSKENSKELFNSLMQKAFRGEL